MPQKLTDKECRRRLAEAEAIGGQPGADNEAKKINAVGGPFRAIRVIRTRADWKEVFGYEYKGGPDSNAGPLFDR